MKCTLCKKECKRLEDLSLNIVSNETEEHLETIDIKNICSDCIKSIEDLSKTKYGFTNLIKRMIKDLEKNEIESDKND